ncbi:MAG: hypothetical protein H0W74_14110 [Sphingosinicella sp.]|nr:hypothetical protein [Sphingosinicella sp.]
MSLLPPPQPMRRPSFYAYVIVDITAAELTPIDVKLSRSDARKIIAWSPDADNLRIKRARVTPYQT